MMKSKGQETEMEVVKGNVGSGDGAEVVVVEEGRAAGGVRGRQRRGVRAFRVTERDLEIVRWIGRWRLATAAQVQKRFGLHQAKAYSRLQGLTRAGLLRAEPGYRGAGVYLATRAGLGAVGLDLSTPPPNTPPTWSQHRC
jgi:hypothetical protein